MNIHLDIINFFLLIFARLILSGVLVHTVFSTAEGVFEIKLKRLSLTGDQTPTLGVWIVNGHNAEPDEGTMPRDSISVNHLTGSFIVTAPPNYGIMTVIEYIDLKSNANGCIDSIRLEQDLGSYTTPKICGELPEDGFFLSADVHSDKYRGPKTFLDPEGKTRIRINVNSQQDLPYILAKILFTTYRECPKELSGTTLARCSMHNNFSCIDRRLFCDSRQHCGFEDEFGLDEAQCHVEKVLRLGFVGVIIILVVVYLLFYAVKKLRDRYRDKKVKVGVANDSHMENAYDNTAMTY